MDSITQTEFRDCPKCGGRITFSFQQYYNVSLCDKRIKDEICHERYGFFSSKCPKCGYQVGIAYPFQYFDPEKKLNFCLVPVGHPAEKKFLDDAESYNNPEYLTRLVADGNALADKILIADANLDDRIVELCKIFMWGDFCEKEPKYNDVSIIDSWFIYSDEDTKYKHTIPYIYENDGERDSLILWLTDSYYKMIKDAFAPIISKMPVRPFDEINSKWAYSTIDLFKKAKRE